MRRTGLGEYKQVSWEVNHISNITGWYFMWIVKGKNSSMRQCPYSSNTRKSAFVQAVQGRMFPFTVVLAPVGSIGPTSTFSPNSGGGKYLPSFAEQTSPVIKPSELSQSVSVQCPLLHVCRIVSWAFLKCTFRKQSYSVFEQNIFRKHWEMKIDIIVTSHGARVNVNWDFMNLKYNLYFQRKDTDFI